MYLMIVNVPSKEDLATAKREMEQEKNKGRHLLSRHRVHYR